jgi:hypothetical protein
MLCCDMLKGPQSPQSHELGESLTRSENVTCLFITPLKVLKEYSLTHALYYFPPLPPWEEENEPQDGMLD